MYLPTKFIPEKANNKEEGNGQNEGQYSAKLYYMKGVNTTK
jgi:hypothetical protein